VPDESGKLLQQALSDLNSAGFIVDGITGQSCSTIQKSSPSFDCKNTPNGTVVGATLPWNSLQPKGAHLTVSYYDTSAK
jgi:hypothetical protein